MQKQQQQPHRNTSNKSPDPMPIITGAPLDGPADCTLACDEGHLTAHKIMICAHSKYLHDILSKFPDAEHPIIILTELNITDIKILVNYMYTGELVITNDGSPSSLLRAAQILKIDSLTDFDDDEDQHRSPTPEEMEEPVEQMDDDDDEDDDAEMERMEQMEQIQQIQQLQQIQQIKQIQQIQQNLNKNINNNISNNINHNSNDSNDNNNNNSNNKIKCHLCNIGLSDVKCLYRHVLTRHLPEKWGYKCEFCDREFSRDDHLMRHYTTKHKNMDFNREKIRETRRLNREMAKNFHDQISKLGGMEGLETHTISCK